MLVSVPAEALSGVFTVLRAAGESVVLVAQTRGMQICQLHLDRWRSVDSSWSPLPGRMADKDYSGRNIWSLGGGEVQACMADILYIMSQNTGSVRKNKGSANSTQAGEQQWRHSQI